MSLVFCDSFDHYTTLGQKWDTVIGSPDIATVAARTGPKGMRCNAGQNYYVIKNLTSKATFTIGVALNVVFTNATTSFIMFSDSGTVQVAISIDGSGIIKAWRGNQSTLLGTASPAVSPLAAFHSYEVRVTIDPTVGVVQVKVDGNTVLNLTSQNTRASANSTANQFTMGCVGTVNATFYLDDLYICDSLGSFNNTFLGDVKVTCALPSADGGTIQWTPDVAGSHFSRVNENPPDDNTSYVGDATVGHIDLYTFPALVAATCLAAVVNLRAEKDDVSTRAIRAEVKSGGAFADSGTDMVMTSGYVDWQGIFETDPNTALAWTVANVNAASFGVKVTV